jgi:predicted N-formylglutamate amidohydrolase
VKRKPFILLTCEHGGNKIPRRYRHYFESRAARTALKTHRGFDIGALKVARALSAELRAPLFFSEISRLLIDLNRTLGKKGSFSEFSLSLPETEKARVAQDYFYPHREAVENKVAAELKKDRKIVHFAIHSFTPELAGEVRNCEIGLLYDPRRNSERAICHEIQRMIRFAWPELRIRLNYPYNGISDGFPPALRRLYGSKNYSGIEIELNQGWLQSKKKDDFNSRLSEILRVAVETTAELRSRK